MFKTHSYYIILRIQEMLLYSGLSDYPTYLQDTLKNAEINKLIKTKAV
jgi:hypothetical protein